jgi:hypothetical protein
MLELLGPTLNDPSFIVEGFLNSIRTLETQILSFYSRVTSSISFSCHLVTPGVWGQD